MQTDGPNKRPCIYIQWEPSDSGSDKSDSEEEACHELRLIPQDSGVGAHLSNAPVLELPRLIGSGSDQIRIVLPGPVFFHCLP